jgi:hypothetical protein
MKKRCLVTQGALLSEACKKRALTNMQLLDMGLSTSPWRRLGEWLDRNPEWMRQPGTFVRLGEHKLVTWKIVRAPKTACT